jgi:hypothetical protein
MLSCYFVCLQLQELTPIVINQLENARKQKVRNPINQSRSLFIFTCLPLHRRSGKKLEEVASRKLTHRYTQLQVRVHTIKQ